MKVHLIFTCVIILIFPTVSLNGQITEWSNGVPLVFPKLDRFSPDNSGNVFLADTEGNIYQYNSRGSQLNLFSPIRQGRLNQLEAFWTVNIFTFSADLQEYRILDRLLKTVAENRIPIDLIMLAKAANLGNNNIIWIYDESDFSLKQFDYIKNLVLQNQPLNLILGRTFLNITEIKEYQNLLFINIPEEGVFVLDNQGNFLKKLPVRINSQMGFWDRYILGPDKDTLVMVDFVTGETHHVILPLESKNVKIGNGFVYIQTDTGLIFYPVKSTPLQKLKY
jgi:hypothetical protein